MLIGRVPSTSDCCPQAGEPIRSLKRRRLTLCAEAHAELKNSWRMAGKAEQVGFLIGDKGRASLFFPVPNLDPRPRRFAVDQASLDAAVRFAIHRDLQIIGRFHTHPGGPSTPSVNDRASLPNGWFELIAHVAVGATCNSLVLLEAFDKAGQSLPLVTLGTVQQTDQTA